MSNTPTTQNLDWGDVVFAYGHQFAKEGKLLGVEVPLHDVKVNREQLAQMMFVADFVGLEQAGVLSLSMGTRKMLFISSETVQVTKLKDAEGGATTRAILNQITGDPNKDSAQSIVYRLLGRDYADPYAVVANWAKTELLKHGYYHEEERGKLGQMLAGSKKIPNRDQLMTLAPQAELIQSALKNAELKNPALYKRLQQDVLAALRSRVEQDRSND